MTDSEKLRRLCQQIKRRKACYEKENQRFYEDINFDTADPTWLAQLCARKAKNDGALEAINYIQDIMDTFDDESEAT